MFRGAFPARIRIRSCLRASPRACRLPVARNTKNYFIQPQAAHSLATRSNFAPRILDESSSQSVIENIKSQWLNSEEDPEMLELMNNLFFDQQDKSLSDDSNFAKEDEYYEQAHLAIMNERVNSNDPRYFMGLFAPGHENAPTDLEIFSVKLHELANVYAMKGLNFEKTKAMFEQAVNLNPYLGGALYDLACLLFSAQMFAESAAYFERVKRLYPLYVPAYVDLATIKITQGDYHGASSILCRANSIDSENSIVNYNIAICAQNMGNIREAADCFARSYELDKSLEKAFFGQIGCLSQLEEWQLVVKLVEKFVVSHTDNYNAYSILGCAYLRIQRLDDAIKAFSYAVELKPNSYEALSNVGMAYFERGDFSKSVDSLRAAIRCSPDSAKLHVSLAHALQMSNDLPGAIEHYEKAIEIDGSCEEALSSLGALYYYKAKSAEQARPLIERALEINPKDADLLHTFGKILEYSREEEQSQHYYQLAYCKYMEQLPELVRLTLQHVQSLDQFYVQIEELLRDPLFDRTQLLQLYCNVASMMRSVGQVDQAIVVYQAIDRADPQYHPALLNLAQLLVSISKNHEALSLYERIQKLVPDQIEPHLGLAELYVKLGRPKDAIEPLKRVLSIDSGIAAAWSLLADCYYETQAFEQAYSAYLTLSKISPDDIDAKLSMGVCLFNVNRAHDAIAIYEHIILESPECHLAYYNLALAKKFIGDFTGAAKDLRKVIQLNPQLSEAKFELGMLMFTNEDQCDANNRITALKLIQQAINDNPDLHKEIPLDIQKRLLAN